jgi:DNA repair exonuclease SbcCD ATPase subunit
MLNIKSISIKNFLSVGAVTQAIDLNRANLTLVLGQNLDLGGDGARNGVGKSVLFNALSYGLYGEALTSIRKNNLINKTNGKSMYVTVDFEIDNNCYRIERGRSPNITKLFVNGTESSNDEALGDSRDTQKDINEIIGFPHGMFKQLIALNTYNEPFLSMNASQQREMIEQLLGITDLSAKAEVLNKLLKNTKDSIREEEITLNTIKASNERIEKNIREIQTRSNAWEKLHSEKIQALEQAIDALDHIDIDVEVAAHNHNATAQKIIQEASAIDTELARELKSLTRSEKNLKSLVADLASAHAGVCPACNQSTDHLETHASYIKELEEKVATETEYYNGLEVKISKLQSKQLDSSQLPQLQTTFYSCLADALEHRHNLQTAQEQLEERNKEINPYVDQITSLTESGLQSLDFTVLNDLVELRDHQEFLHKLLTSKDSFIRKKIIDQNIAYLNSRLAQYLERIGLPHEVKFNSDLSVEITDLGRELDFHNLSRGESNRLILSLSWAFRDIYESLNRPMNLMCIDEILDSGLDTAGMEASLAILKKMTREQKRNIFLISHREELIGRVNDVLTVIKLGGFTEYSTENDS